MTNRVSAWPRARAAVSRRSILLRPSVARQLAWLRTHPMAVRLLAVLTLAVTHVWAHPTLAATTVITRIEDAATTLSDFGRPIAIVAITIVFLAWIAEPMIPDWARENRGAIGRVLFAAIVIGLAPDLVDFFIDAPPA